MCVCDDKMSDKCVDLNNCDPYLLFSRSRIDRHCFLISRGIK